MQLKNPILGLCQQATFSLSAAKVDQCPDDEGFEVAFAGRSNAGKSSALNTLTHASLARTSKTPGRTQLLNFFNLDETAAWSTCRATATPRCRSRSSSTGSVTWRRTWAAVKASRG